MTLKSYLLFLYLKVTGKEYMVSGSCNYCGQCCHRINLKYSNGWIRSPKQFKELVAEIPEYKRFNIIGSDGNGFLHFSCSWLTEGNGCRNYMGRLDICKRYPSKSLYLCGGNLLPGCGYTIRGVTPFKKYLDKEMKKQEIT